MRDNAGRRLRLVQRAAITVCYIKSSRASLLPLAPSLPTATTTTTFPGRSTPEVARLRHSPPLPRALFLVAHSTTMNSAVRVNENVTLRGMGAARSRGEAAREPRPFARILHRIACRPAKAIANNHHLSRRKSTRLLASIFSFYHLFLKWFCIQSSKDSARTRGRNRNNNSFVDFSSRIYLVSCDLYQRARVCPNILAICISKDGCIKKFFSILKIFF